MEDKLKYYAQAAATYDYDTIDQIPFDLIDDTTSIPDFLWYCYVLLTVAEADMFRYIVDMFEELNVNNDLHVINQLMMDLRTNTDVLRKLSEYYPELSPIELIGELTQQAFSEDIRRAIDKIIDIYGIPDASVLKELMSELAAGEQNEFYNCLFNYYTEVSDYAPIPEWIDTSRLISEEELEHKRVELTNPIVTSLTPEELAQDIKQFVGTYVETPTDEIQRQLENSNPEDLRSIHSIMNIIVADKERQEQTEYIKYFGPSNPLRFPLEYLSGEDRMLLCNFWSHDSITGEEEDWFHGSCDMCGLRIRKRHHALRSPVVQGGWEACMCSRKCTEDYINERYYIDASYLLELLDLYVTQLHEHKIYDRE